MSESKMRWETAPGGARNGEFVDVPGLGRYLVKRAAPRDRHFRAYLNGKPTAYTGSAADTKAAVERAVRAHQLAASAAARPTVADAHALLMMAIKLVDPWPAWLQDVEQRTDHICLICEGRVFEVRVR